VRDADRVTDVLEETHLVA